MHALPQCAFLEEDRRKYSQMVFQSWSQQEIDGVNWKNLMTGHLQNVG